MRYLLYLFLSIPLISGGYVSAASAPSQPVSAHHEARLPQKLSHRLKLKLSQAWQSLKEKVRLLADDLIRLLIIAVIVALLISIVVWLLPWPLDVLIMVIALVVLLIFLLRYI